MQLIIFTAAAIKNEQTVKEQFVDTENVKKQINSMQLIKILSDTATTHECV